MRLRSFKGIKRVAGKLRFRRKEPKIDLGKTRNRIFRRHLTHEAIREDEINLKIKGLEQRLKLSLSFTSDIGAIKLVRKARSLVFPISVFLGYGLLSGNLNSGCLTPFMINFVANAIALKTIFDLHSEIKNIFKERGVLNPNFEGYYPENWIKPIEISRTHPVGYIAFNGDLIVKKETKFERWIYLLQKSIIGRLGLNFWKWRIYFRTPELPQSIQEIKAGWNALGRKPAEIEVKK